MVGSRKMYKYVTDAQETSIDSSVNCEYRARDFKRQIWTPWEKKILISSLALVIRYMHMKTAYKYIHTIQSQPIIFPITNTLNI